MTEDWRVRFHRESNAFIAEFVASNPDYTGPEAMDQGWSGHVARGTHRGRPVVFKVYNMHQRWTNELFLYRHYADTGFVPAVHDAVEPRLLVMDYVPGRMPRRDGIDPEFAANVELRADLGRHLGVAVASLVSTPVPTDDEGRFPPQGFIPYSPAGWTEDIGASIQRFVDLGWRINNAVRSYGQDPLFEQFLDFMAGQIEQIVNDRRVVHHSDFGNLNVLGTRVTGFYDLESDHIGTESMILGKMLGAANDYGLDQDSVLQGYASAGGNSALVDHPLRLLALEQMDPFILRTCRDGRWQGTADELRTSEQLGPAAVQRIREGVQRYSRRVDRRARRELDRWFPGTV